MNLLNRVAEYSRLFILSMFIGLLATSLYAVASISNVAISSSSVTGGQNITISFNLLAANNQDTQFAVGFTKYSTIPQCGTDWVVSGAGIYKNITEYYYEGSAGAYVTGTASGLSVTDVDGPDGGNGGLDGPTMEASAAPKWVTVVASVPPEYDGTYYVAVIAHEHNNDLRWNCNNGTTGLVDDTDTTVTFTSTQTKAPQLDLELEPHASAKTAQLEIKYRISNHSESGIVINRLSWQYYINEEGGATWSQTTGSIQKVYTSSSTTYGPDISSLNTITTMTEMDCGDSRIADVVYKKYFNITSGNPAYILIPPGGGYVTSSNSQETILKPSVGTVDQSDDYTRINEGTGLHDTRYATLYLDDELQCEYDDTDDPDDDDSGIDNTGEEPCGVGCGKVNMEKSASTYIATVGDTLTYCITYTNNTGDTQTFKIWDSMPSPMSYVGCDSGCSRNFYGDDEVVWWQLNNITAGTSGTVCFYVKVDGLPYYDFNRIYFSYWKKWDRLSHLSTENKILSKYF